MVWGDAPPGSLARIYWPAVSSAAVIKVASWMYGVHPLTAADAHTSEVKTIKGVTYVPIPQGTGPGFAGLFTVDLPQTVKTGQEFDIVVRRIGKRLRRAAPPLPPPPPVTSVARTRRAGASQTNLPESGLPVRPAPAQAVTARTVASDKLVYERATSSAPSR
jgi:hypothetical protein